MVRGHRPFVDPGLRSDRTNSVLDEIPQKPK